ncbi:conserved uncharacterized protein [Erwinia pyrifoliae Ep1/96]|nr:conserved uncharacterized protein [Erwinia pyrifoliae Ep1/96]
MVPANPHPGEKSRGLHLVTDEIVGELRRLADVQTGLLHLLLQHPSASLTLNENCDATVRSDMEQHFLRAVAENAVYQHADEGADDMPAHIKLSLPGASLMLPVSRGRLVPGTWQGILLGEHRPRAARHIIATLQGDD